MILFRYCVRLPVTIVHVFAQDMTQARRLATQRYAGYSDIWLDDEHAHEPSDEAERAEFDAWMVRQPHYIRASKKVIEGAWLAWKERASRATWLSMPRVDFEALGISLMTRVQRSLSYERWRTWTGGNK